MNIDTILLVRLSLFVGQSLLLLYVMDSEFMIQFGMGIF